MEVIHLFSERPKRATVRLLNDYVFAFSYLRLRRYGRRWNCFLGTLLDEALMCSCRQAKNQGE